MFESRDRLTEEIGDHAVGLLVQETGAQSAPEVLRWG